MGAKKKFTPKSFESRAPSKDTSANIYESMLQSPAFIDLKNNQRLLYMYMKAQYYGKPKPYRDYKDVTEWQGDDLLFYFNHDLAANVYGIYAKTNFRDFYKDIRALIDHGFIEEKSNGKINHRKSVYRFSEKWKIWKPDINAGI